MALKVAGIKEGDVVLCPSLTFAATNVIMFEKTVLFLSIQILILGYGYRALEKL